MPTTHPMVRPLPRSRVLAGNAILASQDSEITGWGPRVWTHGPGLPRSPVSVLCPPADMTSCTLLRTPLNLFIRPFNFGIDVLALIGFSRLNMVINMGRLMVR